jgi:hypothetical protein
VDISKDELTFARKYVLVKSSYRILRPAGKPRVGRNAFGAGLLAVLSGDETKAFSVASATFAPRSSSPVRPHLHAWMLREGEADLASSRPWTSVHRTGVSMLEALLIWTREMRLRIVMAVARWLRVPIDVHGSYWGKDHCVPRRAWTAATDA